LFYDGDCSMYCALIAAWIDQQIDIKIPGQRMAIEHTMDPYV